MKGESIRSHHGGAGSWARHWTERRRGQGGRAETKSRSSVVGKVDVHDLVGPIRTLVAYRDHVIGVGSCEVYRSGASQARVPGYPSTVVEEISTTNEGAVHFERPPSRALQYELHLRNGTGAERQRRWRGSPVVSLHRAGLD